MNNLKRVLSLGLAGTMLSSMMVMGASAADFTDAGDIEHTEAVNILVALNIVAGKEDGSYFDPKGNVTRAEMAKMIAVAMNGGNAASTGTKTTPSFTDIKGHWAESYIEYCADMGIISGRGDGTFDTEANVTGLEATKMVLTAMGFDAKAYQLTGASWASRTDEVARTQTGLKTVNGTPVNDPKLYEELEGVMMAANASRETAAQLIWNGLQNHTRMVEPNKNTNNNEVTWNYTVADDTLLYQRYGASIFTGTYEGNANTGATSTEGEIKVKPATGTAASLPSDLDISNIGEEVKVVYKDNKKAGTSGKPDKHDTIYGVFNTGKTQVINATKADITKSADQPTAADKFEVNGEEYALAVPDVGATLIVKNYDNGQKTTAATGVVSEAKTAFVGLRAEQNGDTIKFVCNEDGAITAAYVVESKIAAVTAVNSTKITLNNSVGTVTIANGDVEDGLKKGDVVVATVLYEAAANDDDAYVIVKKAETVEGTVSGYKNNEFVKLDGESYKIFNKTSMYASIPDETHTISSFNTGDNTYIDEDVTLYMINGYVGMAVQTSESASNYSLVTEVKDNSSAGSTFSGLQLQVMDAEGKKTVINVSDESVDARSSSVDGTSDSNSNDRLDAAEITAAGGSYKKIIDASDYRVGDIVTYTMNSDGEAEVTVEGFLAYTKAQYSADNNTFSANSTNFVRTSNDCVIFVQTENIGDMTKGTDDALFSGAKYKVYNIRDLDKISTTGKGATVVMNSKGTEAVAVFVNTDAGKNPAGATANTVYGIVSAANGRVKDYYSYEVQSNGETYTVNSKDSTIAKGNLVYFDKTNDDNYASGDVKVLSDGYNASGVQAVAGYTYTKDADKTVTFYETRTGSEGNWAGASAKTWALDKNYVIVGVNQDKDTSDAEGDANNEFDSVTGYMNALVVYETVTDDLGNSNSSVLAVFVETSNECNVLNNTLPKATITGGSVNDLKNMGEGAFFLASGSTVSGLIGVTDASKCVYINFTNAPAAAETITVSIKNSSGDEVYTETDSTVAAGDHLIYVDITKTSGSDTNGNSWANGGFTTGVYTYTITGSTSGTILTGSFTL